MSLIKEALVFGHQYPHLDKHEVAVDSKGYQKRYGDYTKRKAKEAPTSTGKASLVGAAVGGAGGAAYGALSAGKGNRGAGAVAGLLAGGVSGGLGGALVAEVDREEIQKAKRLQRMSPSERKRAVKRHMVNRLRSQDNAESHYHAHKAERRHNELMGEIKRTSRHGGRYYA